MLSTICLNFKLAIRKQNVKKYMGIFKEISGFSAKDKCLKKLMSSPAPRSLQKVVTV